MLYETLNDTRSRDHTSRTLPTISGGLYRAPGQWAVAHQTKTSANQQKY